MIDQERLDGLLKRDYPMSVRERGGVFIMALPDLGMIVKAASLDAAYAELKREKEDFFREMLEAGADDLIPMPRGASVSCEVAGGSGRRMPSLGIMLLLAVLLCIAAAVGGYGILSFASSELTPGAVARRLHAGAVSATQRLEQMSQQDKEELRIQMKAAVSAAKPFVDEMWPLLENCPIKLVVPLPIPDSNPAQSEPTAK